MKKPSESTTIKIPTVNLRAELAAPADASQDDGLTFEVTAYTGAEVPRYPMFDEPYLLSMKVDKKSIRLDRFTTGASVVKGHDTFSSDSVIGVTSNPRIENGELKATVRFSSREEIAPLVQDVRDGILRNVSVGVNFYELVELGVDDATGLPRVQATDWEPNHLGLVAVPADAGAHVELSADADLHECKFHRASATADAQLKENIMEKITVRLLSDTEEGKRGARVEILKADYDEALHLIELEDETPKESTSGRQSAATMAREIDEKLAEDNAYKAQIKRVASHYGCDELWAQKQINLEVSVDEAVASATAERAKRSPTGPNSIGLGDDYEAGEAKLEAMAGALTARATRREPVEAERGYAGMSFADLAIECLSMRGKGRGLSARVDSSRILSAELALHTTSDFPLLLANVLNKMLLPAYEAATPTYRRIAKEKPFNDFRPHPMVRGGDFPDLLKVNEHGEFKYGTMGENSEPVTAATYGRVVGLSRQTLINDDLSAFGDLATSAARRIADFENALFFSTCLTAGSGLGPDLSDGDPVFDANHTNITAGGALSNTLLGSALALMMAQTSLDGLKLNIEPRIVLTSPTSVVLARTLLADITPSQASEVNPFAGSMVAIGDANLTGTRFYVLADPAQLANYVYGYVNGQGPRTETRAGFEVDGVEFKLALDFGVGAIDYRGGVTGAGS